MKRQLYPQSPLLALLLITLDLVADLEVSPVLEAHAAFSTLPHLGNVFLDVFEGMQSAWK
jgi:hypothetical protein